MRRKKRRRGSSFDSSWGTTPNTSLVGTVSTVMPRFQDTRRRVRDKRRRVQFLSALVVLCFGSFLKPSMMARPAIVLIISRLIHPSKHMHLRLVLTLFAITLPPTGKCTYIENEHIYSLHAFRLDPWIFHSQGSRQFRLTPYRPPPGRGGIGKTYLSAILEGGKKKKKKKTVHGTGCAYYYEAY